MAEERTLAATVHVNGVVYPAGASVPAEVADQITNPKAWGEEPAKSEPKGDDSGKSEPKPKSKGKAKAEPKQETPAAPESTHGGDELVAPPRVGAGSSAEAWRTYALAAVEKAGLNIEIPEGTKRDDIVEALETAGISTKPKE